MGISFGVLRRISGQDFFEIWHAKYLYSAFILDGTNGWVLGYKSSSLRIPKALLNSFCSSDTAVEKSVPFLLLHVKLKV